MTASKAAGVRRDRMRGISIPNRARRQQEREAKAAEAGKMTFDRLWKTWQEDPENQGKRGTFKTNQRYKKHVQARFGNWEPKTITKGDIDRLRLELAEDHSKGTTLSVIGLIKRIARYGAAQELCPGLSFPIILKGKKLGRDPLSKRVPTAEETSAFVKACETWPDRQEAGFMLLIAYTGMRRYSAQNLKWEDLDLDDQTAVLERSKTGDVKITLSDDAIALLRSHPREMVSPYVFTGKGWTPMLDKEGQPVMHKKNGKMRRMQTSANFPRLTQRQIDRVPRMIADAAGLPLDPCHCWRRDLATALDRAGASLATIKKAGGWKSDKMPGEYIKVRKQTVLDAVNARVRSITGSKTEASA
jgi:integrase